MERNRLGKNLENFYLLGIDKIGRKILENKL
jgi:hypothetical protein